MDVRNLGLSDDDLAALGYKVPRHEARERHGPAATGSSATRRGDSAARTWLWTLAILGLVGWLAHPSRRMPDPVPANHPDTVFSSGRAMSQLVEIARAPRPVGSPEHERVRGLVADRLSALGLEVEVQEADLTAVDSGVVTLATVRNVVARRSGDDATGTVTLTAHYDGVPVSHGAADDGVGMAAILETLRASGAAAPLRNDLLVVITDADELGGLGVSDLLSRDPWGGASTVVLSVDPFGVSGPARLVERMDGNGRVIDRLAAILPSPVATSTARALDTGNGDAAAFRERGIPTLGLVSMGGRSAHHAAADRPINVEEATLQHHGAQLLALTRAFGDADLGEALEPGPDERVYVSLPVVGLVDYPRGRATVVTVGLVLLFLLSVVLLRVRGGDPRRALSGVLLGGVVIGLSAAAGLGLTEMLRRFHPEFGRVDGAVYEAGVHFLALAALVLAVAVGGYAVARRRFSRRELAVGAALLPVAAVVWLTVSAPYALPVAQLALGLSLLAVLPLVLLPSQHHPGRWLRVVLLTLAGGILVATVPELELVATAMTLEEAPVIGAILGVSAILLLPTFEWMMQPKAWWTPALAMAVAAVAFVTAMPAARGDAAHPVPTSLVLLVEDTLVVGPSTSSSAPTGSAPDEAPRGAQPDAAVIDSFSTPTRWLPGRWLTVPGVGEEWARSWVVGPEGSGSDPGALLLPGNASWAVAGTGAEARVPPPTVRLVDRTDDGARSSVTLAVASGLGAEMLAVRLAEGSAGTITAVDGESVAPAPDGQPIRTLIRWGAAHGTTTLRIVTESGRPLALDVLEHHLRPAEVLGDNFFVREDSVIADASTGSDRLIQRVRVDVPSS